MYALLRFYVVIMRLEFLLIIPIATQDSLGMVGNQTLNQKNCKDFNTILGFVINSTS